MGRPRVKGPGRFPRGGQGRAEVFHSVSPTELPAARRVSWSLLWSHASRPVLPEQQPCPVPCGASDGTSLAGRTEIWGDAREQQLTNKQHGRPREAAIPRRPGLSVSTSFAAATRCHTSPAAAALRRQLLFLGTNQPFPAPERGEAVGVRGTGVVAAGNGERGRAWAVFWPGEVRNGNVCRCYPTGGIASSPKGLAPQLGGTAGLRGTGDFIDFSHEQRCRSSTGVPRARGHWCRHQTPQPHSGRASKGTAGPPVRCAAGKLWECQQQQAKQLPPESTASSPRATEPPEGEKS